MLERELAPIFSVLPYQPPPFIPIVRAGEDKPIQPK